MPSNYVAAKATRSKDSDLETILRGPSAWHVHKAKIETQEILNVSTGFVEISNQGIKPKVKGYTHLKEVRCFHSSKEVE